MYSTVGLSKLGFSGPLKLLSNIFGIARAPEWSFWGPLVPLSGDFLGPLESLNSIFGTIRTPKHQAGNQWNSYPAVLGKLIYGTLGTPQRGLLGPQELLSNMFGNTPKLGLLGPLEILGGALGDDWNS